MAWKSFITNVTDNPVPSDHLYVTIEFRQDDGSNRTISQQYKVQKGTTRPEFVQLIRDDRDKLNSLENVRAQLLSVVGNEIT